MQNVMVGVLIVLLMLLFRWLGPPVRRLPFEDNKKPKIKPGGDPPPPMAG